MRKYSIGIIGNGRFGGLLYSTFSKSKNFNVKLFSRNGEIDGVKFFEFSEVCKSDIVIPCVPISEFENSIKEISSEVNPNTLIVDVCSVKEYPAEVMSKYLPDKVDILATHPMFGPDSTMNGKPLFILMLHSLSFLSLIQRSISNNSSFGELRGIALGFKPMSQKYIANVVI